MRQLPTADSTERKSVETMGDRSMVVGCRGPSPNVQGNRPADEMRTEDQSMCRRVRLTVRLGLIVTDCGVTEVLNDRMDLEVEPFLEKPKVAVLRPSRFISVPGQELAFKHFRKDAL
jgi:hypothetical protein